MRHTQGDSAGSGLAKGCLGFPQEGDPLSVCRALLDALLAAEAACLAAPPSPSGARPSLLAGMRRHFFPLVRRMVREAKRDFEMWDELEVQLPCEQQVFAAAAMGLDGGAHGKGTRRVWHFSAPFFPAP